MAGNIKGIIVEIGGDTSGLQKALSKVNSTSSSLSKELRGINSLLKLDPKNTELLNQKQTVLNENIETTKKKLKQLTDIQNQAIEAEANGKKISEENWRALQKEIINTQNKLNKLLLEQDGWNVNGKKIEEFGNKIVNVSSKLDALGTKLTKNLTIGVLGVGVASTKTAIDFETAFTGVEKTVDGTTEQMLNLKQGIRDMAKEIPSSTTEISAVAEAAGQLGIKTDDILSFTRVMIDLGNATNLSAEEAATALAKFANVTNMSSKNYDRLGSTVVALGNNFATTERDIVEMGTRLAATGELTGLSESQIMALATAMSSVGLEAEVGSSAMSKLLKQIQISVETGNKKLQTFAKVSNMSVSDFKKAFEDDAVKALSAFLKGLNDTERNGKSAISILNDMGMTETRLSNTVLSLTNSSDLLNNAIDIGNNAWNENNALTNEASKRYQTTASKLKTTLNRLQDVGTNLGNKLLPTVNKFIDKIDKWVDKLDDLDDATLENIIKIGLFVAAAGPAIKIVGQLTTGVGKVIKTFGQFSQAIGVLKTGTASTNESVNKLASGISAIFSPIGLASAAIIGLVGTISYAVKKSEEETTNAFENIGKGATDFSSGIDTATSHLDSFNSTLFASSEEQQQLQENMNEVQQGITEICKRASEERRGYTDNEIKQLDEYFTKLKELKNRELEIQQNISNAIVQQATQNAQSFQGSLDEYKVQSQEWIKTAQDQKDKELEIINDRTTQEIALLQQRYGEKATLENEEYAKEYNAIIQDKDNAILQANEKVAQVSKIYADGYAQRAEQEDGFYAKLKETNSNVEDENTRHTQRLDEINNSWYATEDMRRGAIEGENAAHNQKLKNLWKDLYANMSDSEEEQLGSWIGMLSDTELYGGKIDDESQKMVNSIISSYDNMPNGTRKAMKNAMSPMLEEMQKSEPSLFAKASSIANGILSNLRKAFDIHSPSKKTRKIFDYVMEGGEIAIEKGSKKMYNQINSLSDTLLSKFNKIPLDMNMRNISNRVIEKSRNIFTTPQIIFNVNQLDEARLQQCFDYINRKFGSAY